MKNIKKKSGQTATELAIFGAILVFVVGAIIRQSFSTVALQTGMYKALRVAFATSFKHSEGMEGSDDPSGDSSRNNASVIFIEDRLSARSAKHAAVDRTPQMLQGSGTFSRNLFMGISTEVPSEWNYQVPKLDMYVNGKHFPVSTSRMKRVCLTQDNTITGLGCQDAPDGSGHEWYGDPTALQYNEWTEGCAYFSEEDPPNDKVDCVSLYGTISNTITEPNFCRTEACVPGCELTDTCADGCTVGCLPCVRTSDGTAPFWKAEGTDNEDFVPCNLSVDERFDLDGDGSIDVLSQEERLTFAWQRLKYRAYPLKADAEELLGNINLAETTKGVPGIGRGSMIDVDDDGDVESIVFVSSGFRFGSGIMVLDVLGISYVDVMDSHEGDVDFSIDGSDGRPVPGFDKDIRMFTEVEDGTVYRVESGQLYGIDDGQVVRSAQRKEQVDWIQRRFQLSNNTGRYCYVDTAGNVQRRVHVGYRGITAGDSNALYGWSYDPINPVEVCCKEGECVAAYGVDIGGDTSCFDENTIRSTCMEMGNVEFITPTTPHTNLSRYPAIFIRSRIRNRQGRKWITDIVSEDYPVGL